MDEVRIGVVGCGGIGINHISYLPKVQGARLTAICDPFPDSLERAKQTCDAETFEDYKALIDSGKIDAVLVCTPHYSHPEIMIHAFSKGVHVMSEKPVGVHVKHAEAMNKAAVEHPELKFGVMFQSRTYPANRKAREMIESGELGEMLRLTCIETQWYRTQSYYDSGGWRATWKGEGGGVLINQCPHTLDLVTWLGGMPKRVTAVCRIGMRHNIEVEDEVAAIMEYENGALGQFITSTGEAPGQSLLELAFDRGLIRIVNEEVQFIRNRVPVLEHLKTSPERFEKPESWDIKLPLPKPDSEESAHQLITQNFVNAILNDESLIAPGQAGLNGLALGNAFLLSGIKNKPVDLPLDADEMEALIEELCEKSTFVKPEVKQAASSDMSSSFHK